MNRKNTILVAVVINAALLAVLFIVALTMQEEPLLEKSIVKEEMIELQLPKFDEAPMFSQEIASLTLPEMPKPMEEPVIVHKLPPMVAEPTIASPAPVAAAVSLSEVVVKKGDSLEKIAKANQTTVDEIIKLNHLPSTFLKIGQVIKIPKERSTLAKPVEKKVVDANFEYYTIKVGENPWAIAQKHHMKVDELLKLNGLNEEKARKLKPGDRLRVK